MKASYRLALQLGTSVEQMATGAPAPMSCLEAVVWEHYGAAEPYGADRDNMHSAQICAMLYNINRKRGASAAKLSQFMFKPAGDNSGTSAKDMFNALLKLGAKEK